jgi:3'-5' exoribonuclease
MKDSFVSDLKPNERVTSFFVVRAKQLEPFRDKAKGEFLSLLLSDRTGQIVARVWDNAPALAETFNVGDILKVAGDVEEYQGRAQLIIQRLRPAAEGEFDLSDFVAATSRDVNAMLATVQAAVWPRRPPRAVCTMPTSAAGSSTSPKSWPCATPSWPNTPS